MIVFKAYRCGQCHNEGSTAGHTCDKCGNALGEGDFLDPRGILNAQLAAATGGTPDSKKLLDAQLAYASTPPQASWHLEDVDRMSDGTCLWCHGFGCAHCGSTGGY